MGYADKKKKKKQVKVLHGLSCKPLYPTSFTRDVLVILMYSFLMIFCSLNHIFSSQTAVNAGWDVMTSAL